MKEAGLFVDSSNLYCCLKNKYKKKLDYTKYRDYLKGLYDIKVCKAYVSTSGTQNNSFVHAIGKIGYSVVEKNVKEYAIGEGDSVKHKCDVDVMMCMDIVRLVSDCRVVILGSADGDMVPCVEWLKEQGVEVIVVACGISGELKKVAHCIEIPYSLLEES